MTDTMQMQVAQVLALDSALSDAAFAAALCPELPVDPGIVRAVRVLWAAGIEAFDSCDGSLGHARSEPFVRFHGARDAGWNAVAAAQRAGLPLRELRRVWTFDEDEPTGPYWDLVLRCPT
jgi:hypothetical protein